MKRIRMFLLSLAAVSSMLVTGNVFAGGELERLPEGETVSEDGSSEKTGSTSEKAKPLSDEEREELLEGSVFHGTDGDGRRIYRNTETDELTWFSEDMKYCFGTFRCCAENGKYRLLADFGTSLMGLENKETGYIWWTSPLESENDPIANETFAGELMSSSVLHYGIPEKRSDNFTLRSGLASDCTISVTQIENGIRVDYSYKKEGFSYPVEYTLGEDYLRASLVVSEIEETSQGKIATSVNLLGSFGAASDDEDGYFVIPDGCGALVRFGSSKSASSGEYFRRIYGNDVTAVPTSRGAVDEQLYLPVFGIVKDGNGVLAVAEKGDSNSLISVKTTSRSNSSYNLCSFVFTLRSTDNYYMTGKNSTSFTVFEKGKIKSDDIAVRYYPIDAENADYTDIAARYREYLTEEKGVEKRAEEGSSPLHVNLYGGVMKKRSVLGIPVEMKTSVTSFSQAQTILSELEAEGVDDMAVTYKNWTNDGIRERIDTDAKPSDKLGGRKDFEELLDYTQEHSIEMYAVADNRDFRSGGGYYSFTDASVRISGAYSRIVSYDLAYGIPDGFAKNKSLLSPKKFSEVLGSETAHKYAERGFDGISLSTLTTSLYGDYGKSTVSRYEAMNRLADCCNTLDCELGSGILADSANAYALPYVSRIMNVPLTSSRYDIFDEDIPFYQLVLHGVIPYSSTAVNAEADPVDTVLMAAVTGSSLTYDMLWEDTALLKNTEFDIYYYANYKGNIRRAAQAYRTVEPILSKVSGCTIDEYITDGGNCITAVYSDGTEVTADFDKKTLTSGGVLYDIGAAGREGGI